jgi:hypothetical protein
VVPITINPLELKNNYIENTETAALKQLPKAKDKL